MALTNQETTLSRNARRAIDANPSLEPLLDELPAKNGPCQLPTVSDLVDREWMRLAIGLAAAAAERGEVPVGAVIVCGEAKIAEAGNFKESNQDPLGHAEIRAIQTAAQKLGRWRLSDCTMYVTLEPCVMCAGAIVHARLGRVVFGATDPKAGAVHSLYQILADPRLNHAPDITGGVLEPECSHQLREFFKSLRFRGAGKL